jgi:hypothetical protein
MGWPAVLGLVTGRATRARERAARVSRRARGRGGGWEGSAADGCGLVKPTSVGGRRREIKLSLVPSWRMKP